MYYTYRSDKFIWRKLRANILAAVFFHFAMLLYITKGESINKTFILLDCFKSLLESSFPKAISSGYRYSCRFSGRLDL